jgi:hypothetical protein
VADGAYDVGRKDKREDSMTIVGRRVALTAIVLSVIPLWYGHRERALVSTQRRPLMATRIFAGTDGLTHVEDVSLQMGSVPGAPASVEESPAVMGAKSYVVRLAPGFTESWHNEEARRYVIPVSGSAEVEVSGGKKVSVEPGRIYLAEDLTGKGHMFRVTGHEDWVAMFVDKGQ